MRYLRATGTVNFSGYISEPASRCLRVFGDVRRLSGEGTVETFADAGDLAGRVVDHSGAVHAGRETDRNPEKAVGGLGILEDRPDLREPALDAAVIPAPDRRVAPGTPSLQIDAQEVDEPPTEAQIAPRPVGGVAGMKALHVGESVLEEAAGDVVDQVRVVDEAPRYGHVAEFGFRERQEHVRVHLIGQLAQLGNIPAQCTVGGGLRKDLEHVPPAREGQCASSGAPP